VVQAKPIGVYVHFPWCRKLCPYCDFAVEVTPSQPPHDQYADAVIAEFDRRRPVYGDVELQSIYFGGGTPSRWRPDCLARVIAHIKAQIPSGQKCEITLEANPVDCSPIALDLWHAAGINRISIGVQSLSSTELVALGRDHSMGDGLAAVRRAAGDARFATSCDIIVGTPTQAAAPEGPAHWVGVLAALPLAHLSVYELTIEDRTVFGKRAAAGLLKPYGEDALAALFQKVHHLLTAAGFIHYEISSYAKPGAMAVHNSLYWTGANYLGIGVGAASLVVNADGSAVRTTNPRRFQSYLATTTADDEVEVSAFDFAVERLWLGMRTVHGVSEQALAIAPGVTAQLVTTGLATVQGGRVTPTLQGFLLADQIASRIVRTAVKPTI
jgi:oxygen-independent coproporphyrinogen III oxidase